MRNEYAVSWVAAYVKNLISQDFMLQSLNVKGEASNVKYHSSGHLYFTLKDKDGSMPVVMFAGKRTGLTFRLEEGMQIVVNGRIDLYERDGRCQIYANTITRVGLGDLYEKYEQLKEELKEMGMFDSGYKQPIPKFVRRLGVVTAPTGAAVRDIISVSKRRFPGVEILLFPAIVQGEQAVKSIVEGIQTLSQMQVDVMIVGRGGGSIEDLWAFNERAVAQAIFDCPVPVISAVGHETDTTIADYVADVRAATPSAGAELAVFDVHKVYMQLANYESKMQQQIHQQLRQHTDQLKILESRLKSLSPESLLEKQSVRLLHFSDKLDLLMDDHLEKNKQRTVVMAGQLEAVSPLRKLKSGYAYLQDSKGESIFHISQVHEEEELSLYILGGKAKAKVMEITPLELLDIKE